MTDDGVTELDAIVVELYALPPAEFTAARTARAKAADAPLAADIRGIRKPTVAAWAVDLLAREGMLGDAMTLAAELRDAQEGMDAAELGRLGRQRRQLVAALAGQAVARADAAGVAVSASARADVEQTLNAAMIDADAAAAVLSGRLTRSIEASGLGGVDLSDALAGSTPSAPEPAPPTDDLAERRARKAAEKAARDAAREAEQAEKESDRAESRRQRAQARVDDLRERLTSLRRELAALDDVAAAAQAELDDLTRSAEAAADAARAAATRAQTAHDACV